MARPCSKTKKNTPKAVRADFKVGLKDGKQAEDTREDRTAWLPILQLTAVSSHGSMRPMAVDFNMGKPGTMAAGGTSHQTHQVHMELCGFALQQQ